MALDRTALFVRRSVGGLFAIEAMADSTGERIFVHSGDGTDSTGFGSGPDKPVATIDFAVGLATASENTQILVMPGHAESIASATDFEIDIAGVEIIGLGKGRLKPQLTIDTADTALISITAANCTIRNVDIISNYLDIATVIDVEATADGLTLDGVNFYDTSVILGALIGISIAATVSDVTIKNCNYYGIELTGAATDCIVCAGAVDRLRIENCYLKGEFSNAILVATAAISLDVVLKDLMVINMSTTGGGLQLKSDSTGMAHNVQAVLLDTGASEKAIVGAAYGMTDEVRQTNAIAASTALTLAIDT